MYLNRSTDAQDGISVKQNTCTRVLRYIDVFHYAVFGHKLQWIFYFLKCTVCKWEGRVYQIYAFIYKKIYILYKITNEIACI